VFDGANIAFETVHFTSQAGVINPDNLEFSFEVFISGVYTVELYAENVQSGQFAKEIKENLINVYDAPLARFEMRPSTVVFVPDEEMTLFNFTDLGRGTETEDERGRSRTVEWLWNFGDETDPSTNGPDNFHIYEKESIDEPNGVFPITLTASFNYGSISCSNVYMDSIKAEFGGTISTPNAFTPNEGGPSGGEVTEFGDRSNDIFIPTTDGVVPGGFIMQIYDRWGVLIFESTNPKIGWDGYYKGQLMPQGVYVYKLDLQLANGERESRIGDITLLR
jgi:gliding motility-associated-like protein